MSLFFFHNLRCSREMPSILNSNWQYYYCRVDEQAKFSRLNGALWADCWSQCTNLLALLSVSLHPLPFCLLSFETNLNSIWLRVVRVDLTESLTDWAYSLHFPTAPLGLTLGFNLAAVINCPVHIRKLFALKVVVSWKFNWSEHAYKPTVIADGRRGLGKDGCQLGSLLWLHYTTYTIDDGRVCTLFVRFRQIGLDSGLTEKCDSKIWLWTSWTAVQHLSSANGQQCLLRMSVNVFLFT